MKRKFFLDQLEDLIEEIPVALSINVEDIDIDSIDTSNDFTAASDQDIILSADGDQIKMDDGTTTRFTFNLDSTPELDVAGDFTIDGTGKIIIEAAVGDEAVFNEGGLDVDFRVESADETHMIFVEGASNRVSIGDQTGSPGATLEVKNHASAGAYGVPLVQLNNNDTDQIALDINAGNVDVNVVDILANDVEDAKVFNISADGLTTGNAFRVDDNSPDTGSRKTALIIQNHASATGATALHVQSDGGNTGMSLDKNASGDAAQNATGLHIDFDRTVASSGTNAHNDIGIDLDINSRSLGTSSVIGMDIDVVGHTDGTHTAYGIDLDVDSADTNIGIQINTAGTHLKLIANADTNDYATFTVADTGDLTIATVGDGTTDSDLVLDVDGDIELNADGGDITFKDDSQTAMSIDMATTAGDAIFKDAGGTEIFRIDGSEDSLHMASSKKLMFGAVEEYIYGDGTDLTIISGVDINLDATNDVVVGGATATSKLEFGGAASGQHIYESTDNKLDIDATTTLELTAPTIELAGATKIDLQGDDVSIGEGTNDITVTFNAGNDGKLKWMEDETEFRFLNSGASAGEKVRAKMLHFTHHAYNDSNGTALRYIPHQSTVDIAAANFTTTNFPQNHWVAPFDGRLVKILMHVQGQLAPSSDGAGSTVTGLHINKNATATEAITVDCADQDTTYTFTFSSNSISAGNTLAISVDPTAAQNDVIATCVWEWDTTGL